MEGELALAFKTFLLRGNLRVPLHHYTLSEELFLSAATAYVLESVLGFVDETSAEGAESDLNECTIEKDLSIDVEIADGFCHMGH